MKVLHVFKTYYPDTRGGTEEFIHQLIVQTRDCGIQSDVFTLSADPHPKGQMVEGVRVISLPLAGKPFGVPWSWSALRQFKHLANQYDLIHFHYPWPLADLLYLWGVRHQKALVTYHLDLVRSPWIVALYRPLMKAFLSRMRAVVCTSQAYIDSSSELLAYQRQLQVIPIGIDEARYPKVDPERVAYWRDRLGGQFFLFIGAFRYYKGLDDLVNACAETSLSVVLLGDGPEKVAIDRLITQRGLEGQIHCVGALDDRDKRAILYLARALVLPSSSRAEAFGISLLEGLMAGKPLVSTELKTGTSWVNQHEKTGLVVSPQSPIALREALLRLNEDDCLVERMGKAARARYEEAFTATHMGKSYATLYEAILQEE